MAMTLLTQPAFTQTRLVEAFSFCARRISAHIAQMCLAFDTTAAQRQHCKVLAESAAVKLHSRSRSSARSSLTRFRHPF